MICGFVFSYCLEYILGILNSSLINFYFANTFIDYNIKPTYLQELPIHSINTSNSIDKEYYSQIVNLVKSIIDLNKLIQATNFPEDKTRLQRQIGVTDLQIDKIVYELYSLTEEEITIVEDSVN